MKLKEVKPRLLIVCLLPLPRGQGGGAGDEVPLPVILCRSSAGSPPGAPVLPSAACSPLQGADWVALEDLVCCVSLPPHPRKQLISVLLGRAVTGGGRDFNSSTSSI